MRERLAHVLMHVGMARVEGGVGGREQQLVELGLAQAPCRAAGSRLEERCRLLVRAAPARSAGWEMLGARALKRAPLGAWVAWAARVGDSKPAHGWHSRQKDLKSSREMVSPPIPQLAWQWNRFSIAGTRVAST